MIRFYRIILLHLTLVHKIYWINRTRTKNLIKDLRKDLLKKENTLNRFQENRIEVNTDYSYITNGWFSTLRGNSADLTEQKTALYWGALVPLIDDLTDVNKFSSVDILKELKNTHPTNNNSIVAARYLVKKLPVYFTETLNNSAQYVLEAQDISIKQLLEEKLSNDELRQITYSKGSQAALLYRMLLKNPLINGEKEAVYTLGYLLQLTNDLFDIYKDFQNHQQTLFTNSSDFNILCHEYENVYQRMCNEFLALDYKKKNIENFLLEITILKARAMVCFDQILLCQQENNNKVEINKFTRKQMVCDMERPSNILQSIKYTYQLFCEIDALMKRGNL